MMGLRRQRGAVLLVSLVILMIITLFVISSANMSSSDLRMVGNFQSRMEQSQNAQQGIEIVLSDVNSFTSATPIPPFPRTISVSRFPLSGGGLTAGYPVIVNAPACIGTVIAPGYTAVNNITLFDTNWSVTATSTDAITGATATITQGVRIRLPSGVCP
jgi:hypothetical protein